MEKLSYPRESSKIVKTHPDSKRSEKERGASAMFATVRIQSVADLTAATLLCKHDEYEDIRSVAQDLQEGGLQSGVRRLHVFLVPPNP